MRSVLEKLKLTFGIDLRTLALFRVAVAVMIIVDLMSRARDLRAHYSDAGILPRVDFLQMASGWRPSLHMISGSATVQGVLFVIAGLFALALLVGYRTRLVTFASWIMLMSLQARNPILLQGGDNLLLMFLFWGMFLPLGARFSVDAALDDEVHKERNDYFSFATVALLVQCMSVYLFSALLKNDPMWIPDGTAVEYALRIGYITTPVAEWLRQFESLTHALTYYVWYLELIGPILIFVPLFWPWMRLALQAMFISMHVGFFFCLRIGLFPLISITSLLSFTPGWVWDKLGAKLRTPERTGITIYYDQDCGFCLKVCKILRTFLLFHEIPILPAQDYPAIHATMQVHNSWVVTDHTGAQHVRWQAILLLLRRSPMFRPLAWLFGGKWFDGIGDRIYHWVATNRPQLGRLTAVWLPYRKQHIHLALPAQLVVAALVLTVLWHNFATLPRFPYPLPGALRDVRSTLVLNQKWNMFAPTPSKYDGWWVVRGQTEGGAAVDVLRGFDGEPVWDRPRDLAHEYPNYRWRKYLTRIAFERDKAYRPSYARYLCRKWNAGRPTDQKLAKIQLFFNREKIELSDDVRPVERIPLYEESCVTTAPPSQGEASKAAPDEDPM